MTGLSDAAAETIVEMGIDWSGIATRSDLRTGLTYALSLVGLELSSKAGRSPAASGQASVNREGLIFPLLDVIRRGRVGSGECRPNQPSRAPASAS